MPASTIIQLRRGTAASWTSANPILAQGEEGYETDTGKIKIGDGVTAWASLPYGGPIGPAQTNVIESYGDGSDGNVTISSGVTTLTKDMYYNNLTINGTGQINIVGYRIFVAGILDISAAGVAAIYSNGGNGSNSASQTGGAVGAASASVTVGGSGAATAGATGVIGAGVQAGTATAGGNGGASNTAGASGAGGPNAGPTAGAVGRAGTATTNVLPIRRYEQDLLRGISLIVAGGGGPGGSAGSGDGTTVGNSCGGGGGGGGGGIVAIWANTINRDGSTAASAIQAMGGRGGNGRNGMGTYTFTIPAGSTASVGDTYMGPNGNIYIVTVPLINTATSLVTQISTSGTPTNTGTLTVITGTGSATITYTAVATTSSAAVANAGIGGGGGGSGGAGGWIFLQYANLTGNTATNALDASGGNGGIGGNGANNYTFTITAGQTASIGATLTNNGQTFYVTTTLTGAQTTLVTVGTGAPTASGSLTFQNGTHSAGPVVYSSFTSGTTAAGANGGSGGNGGRITLLQVTTSTGSESFTGTGSAGNAASGIFGGNIGAGAINRVNL